MIRYKTILIFFILFSIFPPWSIKSGQSQEMRTKERIISSFTGRVPKEWGEGVKGVKARLNTDQKVLALTFDACGGSKSLGYDEKLIKYLESEQFSATLFISGRWIDANPEIFKKLSKNPLFEIENHGLNHKPCSTIGRSIYGIKGTKGGGEIFDEIELNALKILNLTGRKPKYYRPGTTYCDEICVEVANALGYEVVNFSVRGDAGATYSKKQVKEALWNAPPSSIILMHMNHPESETAEGVIETIPELKKRGFKFAKLSEYGLK
ncbi:MAG: polysaccharide deacetylase [Deltaproteobacteria bacterium CG03_land_8_20_14_0_80_45_14]|nr:MAG: polysaccharide deacetylase [Deltaproteobacteria bacterium CG03_land_8_20_14_0_80_45_14]